MPLLSVTMIGLAYAAIFAFFLWLGNGLFVAHLRAECPAHQGHFAMCKKLKCARCLS